MTWALTKGTAVLAVEHMVASKWTLLIAVLATAITEYVSHIPDNLQTAATAAGLFIVVDTLLGVAYAIQQRSLSADGFGRGCIKILVMLTLVLMSVAVDLLLGWQYVTPLFVLYWICAREGLSSLENANKLGFPLPGWIKERLEQFGEIAEGGPQETKPGV